MADTKISALTAITGINVDTAADVIPIVDTSSSTTKKILVDELRNAIGPVSGTATVSTSGTAIDYTSIPSWVKKITVMFGGVSTNGTSNVVVQIGDSGGIEATGYSGAAMRVNTGTVTTANLSTGILVAGSGGITSAAVLHGNITLTLLDASTNTWTFSGVIGHSNDVQGAFVGGSKSLSATLDRVRITTAGGTDTFDAGKVNILYE